jgi:isopenicillin-N N-acyltransferase like protein
MNPPTQPFPIIRVAGPPRERGRSYGRQAGERIAIGLQIYRDAFETVGISWGEAMTYAVRFRDAVRDYDADMHEEILGIAEGSEQPPEAIVALNARTEIIFWHDNERGNRTVLANAQPDECTAALALPPVTADGSTLHGQNWDWNPRCADSAVVLHVSADGSPKGTPDILTFVEGGQLARHGMNSAGIGLTVNGLQCDLDGGKIGVASPLLRRKLLSAPTLAGALDVVLNSDISFSHSLILAHAEGTAVNLEVTPAGSYWLQPEDGLLVHANHFKCPIARAKLQDVGLQRCPESLYRDQRTLEHFQRASGAITVETFKIAFADRFGAPDAVLRTPKARPGGNLSGTVATLIMDLGKRRMWLAPSPYKGVHFTEYGFD